MPPQVCVKCGRPIKPNARFCSGCGQRLEVSTPSSKTQVPLKTGTGAPEDQSEPIPPAVEAALMIRGRISKLQDEKAVLEEEIETIRVKQLVGELTKDEAKKRNDELQGRLDPINKEIEELLAKGITPLEKLQKEQKTHEERIERLQALLESGEVDKAVFDRLDAEYKANLTAVARELENETSKAHHWLTDLEARREQIEFERETLQVRARIDEISKRDVAKQLKDLELEITKITQILKGLRDLLGVSSIPTGNQSTESRASSKRKKAANKCPYCNAKITADTRFCYSCGRLLED